MLSVGTDCCKVIDSVLTTREKAGEGVGADVPVV